MIDLLWQITNFIWAATSFVVMIFLWLFALWAVKVGFKNWRRYSKHRWAKALRKFFAARRAHKRSLQK